MKITLSNFANYGPMPRGRIGLVATVTVTVRRFFITRQYHNVPICRHPSGDWIFANAKDGEKFGWLADLPGPVRGIAYYTPGNQAAELEIDHLNRSKKSEHVPQ